MKQWRSPHALQREFKVALGRELRIRREARGLTQADIARAIRVSHGFVKQLETGQSARLIEQRWIDIQRTLGFDGDELLHDVLKEMA